MVVGDLSKAQIHRTLAFVAHGGSRRSFSFHLKHHITVIHDPGGHSLFGKASTVLLSGLA
ncbi:hypothetical protein BPY_21560 [Bifidobacterium psychraerophilum]